jgi:hypothetical protein
MSHLQFAASILFILPSLSPLMPVEIEWGKPQNGIVLGIASHKDHWMTAEYITFRVYLKNVSEGAFSLLGDSCEFLQVDFVSVDHDSKLDKEIWKGSISPPGTEFEVR